MTNNLIPIQNMIYEIRGHKVMLDSDLAILYGIRTHRLNEAVKRNAGRFPIDFMFQLTKEEWESLISQFAISKEDTRGGRRTLPYAFTEHGILMLSSVLNSEQAIAVNIQIMRTFVQLKQIALTHKDFAERLLSVERYLMQYAQDNNAEIDKINEAINLLMDRTKPAKIGFKTKK